MNDPSLTFIGGVTLYLITHYPIGLPRKKDIANSERRMELTGVLLVVDTLLVYFRRSPEQKVRVQSARKRDGFNSASDGAAGHDRKEAHQNTPRTGGC